MKEGFHGSADNPPSKLESYVAALVIIFSDLCSPPGHMLTITE